MSRGRAIVTGTSGFLAPHLAAFLFERGWSVVGIDRDPGVWTDHQHDLSSGWPDDCELRSSDVIFHLAAAAEIRRSADDDWVDLRDNVRATIHVMRAAVDAGAAVVLASTMGVFDSSAPMTETDPPSPASLYGASKTSAEGYVTAFARSYGTPAGIVRLGNTCGPGMRHGLALDFVRKVRANGSEVQMLGDGSNVRPFMYVSDAVQGFHHAYRQGLDETAPVMHLAPSDAITIRQAVETMADEIGYSGEILWQGQRAGWRGDVAVGRLDTHRANASGWKAAHTSIEAIGRAARELYSEGA